MEKEKKPRKILTYSFVGHRPKAMGGFNEETDRKFLRMAHIFFNKRRIKKHMIFNTGLSLGFETAIAEVAVENGLYWRAVLPCSNQEKYWDEVRKEKYYALLDKCPEIIYRSKKPFTQSCMFDRNTWLVNHCDIFIVYWNGSREKTYKAILYAKCMNKKIINMWRGGLMHEPALFGFVEEPDWLDILEED